MSKFRFAIILSVIIPLFLIMQSCEKNRLNEDDILQMDIKNFVWEGLNYFYLWYNDSYNLRDTRFNNDDERDNFLRQYEDPEQLFYDLLYDYGNVDRFSWIVDDYVALENLFMGTTISYGYKYTLFYHSGDYLTGVVMYVVSESPADRAGLKRGDLFSMVDGTFITENNYRDLLYDKDSYTLSMAEINGNTVVTTDETVSLSAEEVHENPVYITKILNINDKKVGYLFYKAFRSNYEEELNNAFGEFADAGIDELVLDLRYNGGGAVSTCARLGSMIYTADTNLIFCRKDYNDKYGPYRLERYGADAGHYNFYDKVSVDDDSYMPLNSLGLDNIYVLATRYSASASELLINCLRPYIDVTIIGSKTYGKNVGSVTVYDVNDEGNVNPDHSWAMQPIVSKSYNVDYVSEYGNGFDPDNLIEENLAGLQPLGDINETMLKAALDLISGKMTKGDARIVYNYPVFMDSDDLNPYNYHMIFDER